MANSLPPLARSILELLGQQEGARDLEIGGGVALWHYSPHRSTNDIDAWWLVESDRARVAIQQTMEQVSAQNGLELSHRSQSGYDSWDLKREGKTVFAFQVARKSQRVEAPGPVHWGQLRMETLRENLANKMNALIQRGAPRDIVDVAIVLKSGMLTAADCWSLLVKKRPDLSVLTAQANILKVLNALEARKPLGSIADSQERTFAAANRATIRELATMEVGDGTGL